MKRVEDKVRTKDGQEWSYTQVVPETISEATQVYGEEETLYLINSALIVKEQAVARALFKAGKEREEVDKEVAAYKPGAKRGGGGKGAKKQRVYDRVLVLSDKIGQNQEAREAIRDAVREGDWDKANELLDVLENGE